MKNFNTSFDSSFICYLKYNGYLPSKRGDGVFVRGNTPLPEYAQYGIILKNGGMILPYTIEVFHKHLENSKKVQEDKRKKEVWEEIEEYCKKAEERMSSVPYSYTREDLKESEEPSVIYKIPYKGETLVLNINRFTRRPIEEHIDYKKEEIDKGIKNKKIKENIEKLKIIVWKYHTIIPLMGGNVTLITNDGKIVDGEDFSPEDMVDSNKKYRSLTEEVKYLMGGSVERRRYEYSYQYVSPDEMRTGTHTDFYYKYFKGGEEIKISDIAAKILQYL